MDKGERKKYIFAQLRSLPNATQYVEVTKYIENLQQQVKKQKEVINKAIKYINKNLIISSILDGKETYCLNNYTFDYKELLDILKEVSE
jgi:hypothetical protein|nr:MAG TPA_asm: hypothetical protein [Caudoviricetes sp.]